MRESRAYVAAFARGRKITAMPLRDLSKLSRKILTPIILESKARRVIARPVTNRVAVPAIPKEQQRLATISISASRFPLPSSLCHSFK
jgi:hypothetical protein